MTSKTLGFSLTAVFLSALSMVNPTLAGGKSDEKVKVEVQAGKIEGGKQVVALNLTVDPDWYIYANPVGNDLFEGNATKVDLLTKSGAKLLKVDFPEGKEKTLGKESFRIYTGKVTLLATLERGADPVDLRLKVNSCNKDQCLPPGSLKVTVK